MDIRKAHKRKTACELCFWRRWWDSNPRGAHHAKTISSRSRYDLFDSPPYISTVFRALRKCKKNTQEQYEILKFDPAKTLINQGFSAEKTARANAHFECRTFDLSDNSPYISSVILAPEECKKNTQERYEIVKSEPAQSPVRRTFSAGETAEASKNITLITLQLIQHQLILLYHTLTPFATLFPDRLAVLQAGRKKMETPLAFSAGMCYDGLDCTEKARTITCWIFSIFWAR